MMYLAPITDLVYLPMKRIKFLVKSLKEMIVFTGTKSILIFSSNAKQQSTFVDFSKSATHSLIGLIALMLPLMANASQLQFDQAIETIDSQMVRVSGGSFSMGCTPEQESCESDESPVREVVVGSFEISRFEITQELWQSVMDENPSTFDDCPKCPVETVSWDDIQLFLSKINVGTENYRLPTEAEWEYASRGGQLSKNYQYAGSNAHAEVGWYYRNSENRTHPVGSKIANELGLFDMSGNVREWVQDCYHSSYVDAPDNGSARGENCADRVIRGGSWYGKSKYLRVANRFWYSTFFRNNNLGFRLARDIVDYLDENKR